MAKRVGRAVGDLPEQQELKQLSAAPLVDVSGVVKAGAAGGKSRGEKAWTLLLQLQPWRVEGGDVRESALFVRKRGMTEREMSRHVNRIKASSILRLRARVVEPSVMGRPAALATKLAGPERADADLLRRAKELQEPVVVKDEQFGKLTLDPRWRSSYTAKVKWNGRPVELSLEAEAPEQLQAALKTARLLWKAQAAWQKRLEKYVIKEMLTDKNDLWLEGGRSR